VGKSSLFENAIFHDALYGHAVILIDPHGDVTRNCLARLPHYVLDKVSLLDMEDEAYPFGVNVFGKLGNLSSIAQAQAVDRTMHIFDVVWHDSLKQLHLPRLLRNATIALLDNPGATLVDMYGFLVDDSHRTAMLKHVTDPAIVRFWQQQYDERQAQPLINRLEALFMGRSLVRNIVGQRQNTINFRQAIENKEIIFIKLPLKTLYHDARLIGTMLIAQIYAAIFSFADVPEAERPGVSLYTDEFQHFATPDFSELFTEGRKFGARITVAHQQRHQLPEYLQHATLTARTKICFQLTPEDGREMAHVFPNRQAVVRPEDITPHPVEHLLTYGSDHFFVRQFTELYLRPLQAHRSAGKIELHPGRSVIQNMTPHIGQPPNPIVDDPTGYLNQLLYQVMKKGNPNLIIPPQVIYGFADSGLGFYHAYLYEVDKDYFLGPAVGFPKALAVPTANGNLRWTRPPETGKEQLYHFIFHLRMTMAHLAKEPVGSKSVPNITDIAHDLTRLPRRAAWVRSGDDMGVIYTHPKPEPLAAAEFAKRLETVMAQTRAKYCHPKTEVESRLFAAPEKATPNKAADAPRVSRWEDVDE
jgi:hypothetical protein